MRGEKREEKRTSRRGWDALFRKALMKRKMDFSKKHASFSSQFLCSSSLR